MFIAVFFGVFQMKNTDKIRCFSNFVEIFFLSIFLINVPADPLNILLASLGVSPQRAPFRHKFRYDIKTPNSVPFRYSNMSMSYSSVPFRFMLFQNEGGKFHCTKANI